jgi:hypothetical protein
MTRITFNSPTCKIDISTGRGALARPWVPTERYSHPSTMVIIRRWMA